MKTIKILHLYPNLMNLYGDYANVLVLQKHLKDQGYDVKVDKKDIEDKYDLTKYDFIYMGSGKESHAMIALENLKKHITELKKCIKDRKVILFTGNALELLGKTINEKKALGIFEYDVTFTSKRYTGDVIVENEHVGEVVGFINKCSLISYSDDVKLFSYVFKDNNLVDNGFEGYRKNNLFATHIIGPILLKNPNFARMIEEKIVGKPVKKINYPYEQESYDVTLNALKQR